MEGKICLKTLAEATEQEVFDQVKDHLLSQNEKSVRFGTKECVYRGPGGLTCAAGCLIGDDEYDTKFEDNTWYALHVDKLVPDEHYDLILKLQSIHDNEEPQDWPDKLEELATKHGLRYN